MIKVSEYNMDELKNNLTVKERFILGEIYYFDKENGYCSIEALLNEVDLDHLAYDYDFKKKALHMAADKLGDYIYEEVIEKFEDVFSKCYREVIKSFILSLIEKVSQAPYNLVNITKIPYIEYKVVKDINELPEVKVMKYVKMNNIVELKISDLGKIINQEDIGFVIGKLKKDNKAGIRNGAIFFKNIELYDYEKEIKNGNEKVIKELINRNVIKEETEIIDILIEPTNRLIEFEQNNLC